jgi:hypothetical protein
VGVELAPLENLNCGCCDPVQAMPASKNGEISSGRYGKLIKPNPLVPKNGTRSSALKTPMRLPSMRSKIGHRLAVAAELLPTHSLADSDP